MFVSKLNRRRVLKGILKQHESADDALYSDAAILTSVLNAFVILYGWYLPHDFLYKSWRIQ
jgi:hypothetical protein